MLDIELDSIAQTFSEEGIVMIEHALCGRALANLEAAFAGSAGTRHRRMPVQLIGDLKQHPILDPLAKRLIGNSARLVRIVAFDKTPEANWFVPWHQDRTVALANRSEVMGFEQWTTKNGTVHAEPPIALLEQMATLRVHLDPCDEAAGPLEVVPGSHLDGRLDRSGVKAMLAGRASRLCLAEPGDILAMRPLLLHRSKRAIAPLRRRVLHLEYCAAPLAAGLDWSLDHLQGGPVH